MAILKYILAIAAAAILTGCHEDFMPDVDTTPVLCINSLITAGQPIEVRVSRTWLYNDFESENNHEAEDAQISVMANGCSVGPDYLPKEGDVIRIFAESATYGTATAEVTVPYAIPAGRVKVTPKVTSIWKDDEGFDFYEMIASLVFDLGIELEVNDPAQTDNYYQFGYSWFSPSVDGVTDNYTTMLGIGELEYDLEPIFKEHIDVFEIAMGNAEDTRFAFFTDRQFPGKTYTLNLHFKDNIYQMISPEYDESLLECGINLYLASVSKSYYNWAVYKWYADEGIAGDLSDIGMAESKWGYSNVSTGAGVVAAQSYSKVTIDLKDFLEQTLNEL